MISKSVSLKESTRSNTAARFGIDNTPNPTQLEAMVHTAEHIIDSVRKQFGDAVDVSSFFRSEKLNKKVGGSKSSQHCKGEAVDLDSRDNALNLAIFNFIKDNMVFDQLIAEYVDQSGVPSWIHVSFVDTSKYPNRTNRQQVLVKLKDRYIPYGEYQVGMT